MKKVLVISEVPTHPIVAGNQQYTLAYISLIKEMGYDVYYFLGYEHYVKRELFEETKDFWEDHFLYYKQNSFLSCYQRVIRKTHKIFQNITRRYVYKIDVIYMKGMNSFLRKIQQRYKFDIVVVNYIFYSKAFLAFPTAKKILVTHDVFTNRYERTGVMSFFSTSAEQEKKALDRSDCILSIQENESIFFRYLTNKKVITGYCPVEERITPFCNNKSIAYIGAGIPYNVKSIHDFVRNVFPLILANFPDVMLYVAGSVCESFDHSLYHSNVVLLGRVNDIDSFYKISDIIINPTENGTGLKIKNVEALMYNKILISHPHTIEGFFEQDSVPIKLASTPQEYADIISVLLNDPQKIIDSKNEVKNYIKKYNTFVRNQLQKVFT